MEITISTLQLLSLSQNSSNRRCMASVHFLQGAMYTSSAPDNIPVDENIKRIVANLQKSR